MRPVVTIPRPRIRGTLAYSPMDPGNNQTGRERRGRGDVLEAGALMLRQVSLLVTAAQAVIRDDNMVT